MVFAGLCVIPLAAAANGLEAARFLKVSEDDTRYENVAVNQRWGVPQPRHRAMTNTEISTI